MLLDSLPDMVVAKAVELSSREKARRLPIHMVHRWWSRRFAAVYRMLLAAYLYDDAETILRAIEEPWTMRSKARGRVFFEPMMGGGTGLAEAVLAGWDAYGVDVNPVAVLAARASLFIAAKGLPSDFERTVTEILDAAFSSVRELWSYNGGIVCHIFVSRGKAPTWLSFNRGRLVLLCPNCYTIFENDSSPTSCPSCGDRVEASMEPVIDLPPGLPEEAPNWRAFAIELRVLSNERWKKSYVSAVKDPQLCRWLSITAAVAREKAVTAVEAIKEVLEVEEHDRLWRAGINYSYELFTPRQLVSFQAYARAARRFERINPALLAAAASEAAKSCCLLAKWYPKLGEIVPAGGVKAHWVPEYTAAANPLAHAGLTPLARGVIASSLRAQLRANRYVQKAGGPSRAKWVAATGDACEAALPSSIDLAVLDPPYGRVKSYASLSAPHFYALKLFEAAAGLQLTDHIALKDVEAREATPRTSTFHQVIERIAERVAVRLREKGRIVLMYNALGFEEWVKMLSVFRNMNLHPQAVYWVLGEPPSGITTSRLKGMHLIVFAKKPQAQVHIVYDEPLHSAERIANLNEELEGHANRNLIRALKQIYSVVPGYEIY
ncbi:MAG: hypothetical protein QXI55_05815 [Thermofilum sp.]